MENEVVRERGREERLSIVQREKQEVGMRNEFYFLRSIWKNRIYQKDEGDRGPQVNSHIKMKVIVQVTSCEQLTCVSL